MVRAEDCRVRGGRVGEGKVEVRRKKVEVEGRDFDRRNMKA